jgi:hypothetical protein
MIVDLRATGGSNRGKLTAWDVYITRQLYRTLTASMTPTTNNPVVAQHVQVVVAVAHPAG